MTGLLALLPLALAAASPDAASTERGLWMGRIHLCRGTVASARIVPDPHDGSVDTLYVRLRPAEQQLFARETAANIGSALTIRLDGRVLSAPVIREEITGGQVQISAPGADLRAARRAARGPCRSARR
jgi:preprotein translocase subunit SecD